MQPITYSRIMLFIGIILIVLSAFGVSFGPANLFEIGVAFSFSSFLL